MMTIRTVAIIVAAAVFLLSWMRATIDYHVIRALSAIALSILVAGCAGARYGYGNFIPDSPINQQPIIEDAAGQLVRLYPPAQNTFALQEKTPDKFGRELVQELRGRGYAVAEVGPSGKAPDSPGALALRYVFDRPDANLYRLTLLVGSQTLSRPYREQFADLVPAGDWIRRE